MSQYSRSQPDQGGALVGDARICGNCGGRVSTHDHYCSSCGVAFAGAPPRVDQSRQLPGFGYHFVQGLGWGFGFIVAGAIVTAVFWLLVAIAFRLATKA
jgi:hypothetical protein